MSLTVSSHLSNKGSEWTLRIPLSADDSTLHTIPGLRLNGNVAVGLVDAIAAACDVLKLAPPIRAPIDTRRIDERLFLFQRTGVGRLLEITSRSGGALLADDVGLGKTLQAIEFARIRGGRTLIVCPAYVRGNWVKEVTQFLKQTIVVRDTLTTKAKRTHYEQYSNTAPFVVTSYELADAAFKECFATQFPTTLIMDEAHYLCGRQSKRGKRLSEIAALTPYKLALTATPAWNRPRDFYSLLRVLFGSRFGAPSSFDFRYCAGSINEFGGMVNRGVSNADELRLRLSYYMLRREKKEVLKELPALTRQITWVDATKSATDEFRRIQGLNALDTANVSRALEATHEGKLQTAVELAVQARQFLLFTFRKAHAHKLHQLINEQDTPCVCITGDLSTDKRAALCAEAAAKHIGVVATIDSAGAGLNMQNIAHYGIMHAIDWLPNKMHQAEGRLHRIGQTNGVLWNYLAMKDSADEMVVRSVVEKMDQMHSILGGERDMRNDISDSLTVSPEVEASLLQQMYDDL